MTYVLGRIQNSSSYIIADSVITSKVEKPEEIHSILISESYSSFGEASIQKETEVIQESTKKIYASGDEILIAFAGDAKEAYNVIQNLIISPRIIDETELAIEYFTRHNPRIELLVSVKCSSSKVRLYNYNVDEKNKAKLCLEEKTYHLGSINDSLRDTIEEFTENLFSLKEVGSDIMLQIICSFLQTLMFSDSIDSGIGGLYIGATHYNTIQYQKDTAFILMKGSDIENLNFSLIGAFNREDKTIVNSPFLTRPYRLLIPYIPNEEVDKINRSFSFTDDSIWEDLFHRINSIEYDFYTFLFQHSSGVIRILLIPNIDERCDEIFEIKDGKIIPKIEEFIAKINNMLNNSGEFIQVL